MLKEGDNEDNAMTAIIATPVIIRSHPPINLNITDQVSMKMVAILLALYIKMYYFKTVLIR